MRKIQLAFLLTLVFFTAAIFGQVAAQQKVVSTAFPCTENPHAREFDFWVGEWDVYKSGTTQLVGHSLIQVVSDGCAILENWTAAGGSGSGKSLNFIDPSTGKWKQTWVGSRGPQDFVNGEYKDTAMRFTFESTDPKGHKSTGRFIFYKESPDQVRQLNKVSVDEGKTWTTSYDLTYIRKKTVN